MKPQQPLCTIALEAQVVYQRQTLPALYSTCYRYNVTHVRTLLTHVFNAVGFYPPLNILCLTLPNPSLQQLLKRLDHETPSSQSVGKGVLAL